MRAARPPEVRAYHRDSPRRAPRPTRAPTPLTPDLITQEKKKTGENVVRRARTGRAPPPPAAAATRRRHRRRRRPSLGSLGLHCAFPQLSARSLLAKPSPLITAAPRRRHCLSQPLRRTLPPPPTPPPLRRRLSQPLRLAATLNPSALSKYAITRLSLVAP